MGLILLTVMRDEQQKEFAELQLRMADDKAAKWVEEAIHQLSRQADDLRKYRDAIHEGRDASEQLSWAMNALACLQSNLRLDLAVSSAVDCKKAQLELAALKGDK